MTCVSLTPAEAARMIDAELVCGAEPGLANQFVAAIKTSFCNQSIDAEGRHE